MTIRVVAYGGGVNSTAMLIELTNRHEAVDLILFGDTGGELPHTYNFISRFSQWLKENGQPEIIVVKKSGIQETLEEYCLRVKVLPALAYGYKACSQKFKIEPQDKYIRNWKPAKQEWKNGRKLIKLIGYDMDECHRARKAPAGDNRYINRYPLIEWAYGRKQCIKIIEQAGLCLPGKSACFFCPSTKISEIKQLARHFPEFANRALALEANAEFKTIKGLGRDFSWRNVLSQQELFDDDYPVMDMTCDCYDGG